MPRINTQNFELTDRGQAVRELNALRRAELSAAEAYRRAVAAAPADDPLKARAVDVLREAGRHHQASAEILGDRVRSLGGHPADPAEPRGPWAEAARAAADNPLAAHALRTLKAAEEQALHQDQQALDEVDEGSRGVVLQQLIPAQQQHLAALDRLILSATGA
ncbi:MAG TPA: hypothetical protein VF796_24125 [Humisphaera sp.]